MASSLSNSYNRHADDGLVVIKNTQSNRTFPISSGSEATSQNSCNLHSKTIGTMPSMRLKYTEWTPEPSETATKHINRSQHSGWLPLTPTCAGSYRMVLACYIPPTWEQRWRWRCGHGFIVCNSRQCSLGYGLHMTLRPILGRSIELLLGCRRMAALYLVCMTRRRDKKWMKCFRRLGCVRHLISLANDRYYISINILNSFSCFLLISLL
jgi:hypothetical protein